MKVRARRELYFFGYTVEPIRTLETAGLLCQVGEGARSTRYWQGTSNRAVKTYWTRVLHRGGYSDTTGAVVPLVTVRHW